MATAQQESLGGLAGVAAGHTPELKFQGLARSQLDGARPLRTRWPPACHREGLHPLHGRRPAYRAVEFFLPLQDTPGGGRHARAFAARHSAAILT